MLIAGYKGAQDGNAKPPTGEGRLPACSRGAATDRRDHELSMLQAQQEAQAAVDKLRSMKHQHAQDKVEKVVMSEKFLKQVEDRVATDIEKKLEAKVSRVSSKVSLTDGSIGRSGHEDKDATSSGAATSCTKTSQGEAAAGKTKRGAASFAGGGAGYQAY